MGPAKDCGRGPERGPEIPPDIVISSSPTFSRRKNFKEAARRRSQEKLRLKRLSMEAGTKTDSILEEQTELSQEESSQFAVEEEKTDIVVEQSSQVTEFIAEDHSVEDVVVVEQSSESVVEEEMEQRMEAVVEQSSTIMESVAVEEIEQRIDVEVEQSSNHTESVVVEEIEQKIEASLEQSSSHTESVAVEETEQSSEVAVEQSSQVTESVVVEQIEQRMEVAVEQSSDVTECVEVEEIEQRSEALVEQSLNITESVVEEEIKQKMEAAFEQHSQVTESVAVEEDETGDSVMSVVESAGAERFQPSPSGTPGRNIPSSLSLPLERDPAPTHFWTANSARQSPGEGLSSPTDSARELLLQKRVSLTHTPDIIRVFDRESQASRQHQQHEFQKVKNELKRVEDTTGRRLSEISLSSRRGTGMAADNSSSSSSSNLGEDQEAMRRSNSKDLILDLVPAPVEALDVKNKEEEKEEVKVEVKVQSKKAVKKERSQTAMISDVLSSSSRIKSLKQGGQKPESDSGTKTRAKKPESGNSMRNNASKKHGDLESPGLLANINGVKSVSGPARKSGVKDEAQTGKVRSRSLSPAKKAATEAGNKKLERKPSVHVKRQNSKIARDRTALKDQNLNGENKENGVAAIKPQKTTSNSSVKGGFLAPTKSWLLYMGNQIDLKSRSPSPGRKDIGPVGGRARKSLERSPSPRRRLRESSTASTESEKSTVRSRKSSVGPPGRKVIEKDPKLPIVKRSNSIKKKPVAVNGDVKGSDNIKKTVETNVGTNGPDNSSKATKTSREHNNVAQTNLTERQKPAPSSTQLEDLSLELTKCEAQHVSAEEIREESGVEISSITASQAIQKFESRTAGSSLLYQDTVSSALKKVSAEELQLSERKVSEARTVESTEETAESLSSNNKTSRSKSVSAVKKNSFESKKESSVSSITSSSLVSSAVSTIKKSSSSLSVETNSSETSKGSKSFKEQKTSNGCIKDLNKSSEAQNGLLNGTSSSVRTTMVVRLHPGQSKRLSAYLDQKDEKEVSSQRWEGSVQYSDNPASVCGLEISFSSIPQDIDIKLIPGNKYCNIVNTDNITPS